MVQQATNASVLSLRVLRVAHEARMSHGLRHKDYQMYRQYCSRRIRRLRKRFDIRQGEKKFRKRELQPTAIKDEKLLVLPLLMAERYWAYAMQLKEESMQDPRKKFALRNKLRKAATYCVNFEKIVEACGKCDARTQLEVQGYSAWLQGTVLFELAEWTQQWDAPIVFFNKAIAIYSKLSEAVTEEEAGIIKGLVAEVEVQLRYCRHHLGDKAATSSLLAMTDDSALGEKLNVLVSQAREKQAATLSEVSWRGRTLTVKQEKVFYFCLLSSSFKTRQAANTGPVSSGHFLYSYLCYLRLRLTLARHMALLAQYSAIIAGKASAPKGSKVPRDQDVVRLCDFSIQNLNEMCQLAGLEDDLELKQENDTKIAYFKALRCYHVAESYAKQEKWAEALTLYKRSEQRIAEAKALPNLNESDAASLDALSEQLAGMSVSVKAQALLPSPSTTPQLSPAHSIKKPLSERMDEYVEDQCLLNHTNPRVLPMPPSLSPVPCKPLFFDLALSHVTYPSLEHRLPAPEEPSPAQQKAAQQPGGLSGLVKGLWGWGSKK
ncbi:Signal recognition particle subunit SRP68 [Trinorchestia longiramus]|nr:Signal recognition particle subunit SRP68 [Trinorchestia longiramus]